MVTTFSPSGDGPKTTAQSFRSPVGKRRLDTDDDTDVRLLRARMPPGGDPDPGSNLSAVYDEHFSVVPANTPDLLDAAYALRYQVYCVEHAFEDPAQQTGDRERDHYDAHSVHAVLVSKRTGAVVGCVRLILPATGLGDPASARAPFTDSDHALPIRRLLSAQDRERLDTYPRERTAEISRYAISKMFRRREGESLYADVHMGDLQANDARRLAPHVSLGLIRGVGKLAAYHGITNVCAAMAPPLLRLLERFGLVFERLGPAIEYHGLRQPCIANCEALLAGLEHRNPDYYRVVAKEYRGVSVPKPAN
jgi:N-acyl amino acid synthase of PEP-CTERM/exosortase system